ncbi:hypothetical protein [Mesorhizobium sp. M8A.F.Ca.ET.161.01.1.1]|uniref:hypothetical protein n=1 Tax=Mesorhizobium sp. M8A.F.Ca.ET.161.01.1.1 TaxID=2563959 RepID=UPI0011344617|nr:hypothetical protein [Mesorhizobium sp. M8A.F.Ca.ET.161.01.1.1]TGV43865.1 hypothetical protein EN785_07705 [Mesorhizobium sp. M8A.F.Ca.ET.142.01.1.1]TGW07359.1 hypothetical protein EN788_37220 [Mesorhizobium sp. M2D.F.Ca.ET.145.01.1.1]
MVEIYYRYVDPWTAGEVPFLQELPVARHTAKCVVLDEYGVDRFVLKNPEGRRYAYPTKELALMSYIIRKQRQMQHAANSHDIARANLEVAQKIERGEAMPAKGTLSFDGL